MAAAAFDDGVEDGGPLAGLAVAYEEPVLLPNCGGADGVFHRVMPPPDLCRVVKLEAHITTILNYQRAA
jgi:hypothetical protein